MKQTDNFSLYNIKIEMRISFYSNLLANKLMVTRAATLLYYSVISVNPNLISEYHDKSTPAHAGLILTYVI